MADFSHLQDFLHPVSKTFLNDDQEYDAFQIGGVIDVFEDDHHPDLDGDTRLVE
jgi:formiminoglutamase